MVMLLVATLCAMMGCDEETEEILGTVERETIYGTFIGQHYAHNGYESQRFLGIPYAKAPVGDLRFRPPQDPERFDEKPLEAFAFAPVCPQKMMATSLLELTGDEDCLYLNVWAPADAKPGDTYPVMVFLHGGSNALGSGDQTIGDFLEMVKLSNSSIDLGPIVDQINSPALDSRVYTGHYFAGAQDVILVTINYRLGPLGHLANPAVGEGSGNFTFLDIRKALEWVQFAIKDFGGNADNVTLFGESSGAWDTCAMMNMPSAKGLFHKAIMESQSCLSRTLEQAEEYGAYYTRNVGCDDAYDVAKCLRDADVNAFFIMNTRGRPVGETPFLPAIDGDIFPEHFADAVKTEAFNHVPLIIGSNEHELYLNGLTDIGFNCQREANLAIFDDYLRAPIYEYRFDNRPLSSLIPVVHSFELPYVFGSADEMFNHSKREITVSRIVNAYWASFARTGNPNFSGQPYWPEYNGKSQRYLRLNASPSVGSGSLIYHEVNCLYSLEMNALVLGKQIDFW